ncbi:hypothetical protein F511_24066 [Dorcoceras hygrometricum]|uniref:Uncharacterized protein n=1 Tax=Dorcoceras hygrometricum TaxID=472368 RepID=A0A2Z7BF04_9LAMI|nr:hypothetical protein F511_24066 [Dorcoceras hygrometricum]
MSNVEQEADNSKRNSEESDAVLKNQQRASTSSWYLELANAKRCRLHKLIRQLLAFALWIQQMLFAMRKTSRYILLVGYQQLATSQDTRTSRWEIQSQAFHDQRLDNQLQTYRYNQLDIQTQAIFIQSRATGDPVEGYSALHIQSTKNSAEAQSSSRHESAAKQLTIYESWMSTAERNKICTILGNSTIYRGICTEMERRQFGLDKRRTDLDSLSNGYIQTEAIYAKAAPLKKVDECEKETQRES